MNNYLNNARLRALAFMLLTLLGIGAASAFRTDTIAVSGPGLDHAMPALVAVPDRAGADSRCPTVYLLHGYGGDETNWLSKQPRIGELADQYGIIVVTPGVGDTWYLDAPGKPGQQVETFFVNSLVPYIDSHYPTIDDRSKRAIAGLSMGGHGALYLAARHPQLFGAAEAISGGVDIRPFGNNWKIKEAIGTIEEHPERWDAATVATKIPELKAGDIAIVLDCGDKDFFYQVNKQLHEDLLAAEVPHDYICRPGGHSWQYWNNAVLYALLYFNEYFNR